MLIPNWLTYNDTKEPTDLGQDAVDVEDNGKHKVCQGYGIAGSQTVWDAWFTIQGEGAGDFKNKIPCRYYEKFKGDMPLEHNLTFAPSSLVSDALPYDSFFKPPKKCDQKCPHDLPWGPHNRLDTDELKKMHQLSTAAPRQNILVEMVQKTGFNAKSRRKFYRGPASLGISDEFRRCCSKWQRKSRSCSERRCWHSFWSTHGVYLRFPFDKTLKSHEIGISTLQKNVYNSANLKCRSRSRMGLKGMSTMVYV